VWSVAFSPDGKTLASGGEDGVVMVWNIASSQGTALNHPSMTIWCVAFSPDGKTLAAGGEDDTITFWDVTTGKLRGSPLHGHTNTIYDLAFNNAGTLLASGSRDRTIILWDVASQKLSGVPLTGFNNSVYAVAFSPDGQTLASGSCGEGDTNIRCTQGEIRLWDVPRRQLLGTPLTSHTDRVYSLAFSPIGSKLVSGGLGKTIILWDLDVDTWQRKICTTVSRNLTPSEWTQYMGDLPWRATCPGLP